VDVLLVIFATKFDYMACVNYFSDYQDDIYVIELVERKVSKVESDGVIDMEQCIKTTTRYNDFNRANKAFVSVISNINNNSSKTEITFYKEISENNKLSKEIIGTYTIK